MSLGLVPSSGNSFAPFTYEFLDGSCFGLDGHLDGRLGLLHE